MMGLVICKTNLPLWQLDEMAFLAERKGFEPLVRKNRTPDFESAKVAYFHRFQSTPFPDINPLLLLG